MSIAELERRLDKATDPSVGELITRYGTNLNKLKMDTAQGKIDPTKALMAKMAIDRIVAANTQPPAQGSVFQEQMAPAGLPAVPMRPDMFQGMAGGGIVAMANGGTPPTFTDALYGADPNIPVRPYQFQQADMEPRRSFGTGKPLTIQEKIARYKFLLEAAPQVAEEELNKDPELKAALSPKPAAPAAPTPAPAVKPPAGLPAAAAAAKPTAPAAGVAGLDEYKKAEEERIKAMEKAVGKQTTTPEEVARQQEIYKAMGVDPDFFQKRARELVQQTEALKGDRKEAANMRLLEAGLSILGGTSPYAFENIGKGASKALAGFADDIKDIKKQTRELDKARQEVLAAEQAAARSDSATISARLDRSKEKVEAKEEAVRNAKSDLQKNLYSMDLEGRKTAATELSAKAQMTSAQRPRESERKPTSFKDIIEIAKSLTPSGKVWESMTDQERQNLIDQAQIYNAFNASGMSLSSVLSPSFQEALRRNLLGK